MFTGDGKDTCSPTEFTQGSFSISVFRQVTISISVLMVTGGQLRTGRDPGLGGKTVADISLKLGL